MAQDRYVGLRWGVAGGLMAVALGAHQMGCFPIPYEDCPGCEGNGAVAAPGSTGAGGSMAQGGGGAVGGGGTGADGGAGGAGVVCRPGEVKECVTGLPDACGPGTQVCNHEGTAFGKCRATAGDVEVCGNQNDDNCDGEDICTGNGAFTVKLDVPADSRGLGIVSTAYPYGDIIAVGIENALVGAGGAISKAQMFLIRIDSATGSIKKGKVFGDAEGLVIPWGLAMTPDGAIVVSGQLNGSADFTGGSSSGGNVTSVGNDLFVAKFDVDLSLIWFRHIDASERVDQSRVGVAADGGILVAGEFGGTVSFGGDALIAANDSTDGFVVKFSTDGSHVWSRKLNAGNNSTVRVRGLAISPTQDIDVAGYFHGSLSIDGDDQTTTGGVDDYDVFVAQLRGADGAYVWKNVAGDNGPQRLNALAVDNHGDVLLTGYFRKQLDFAGDACSALTNPSGSLDASVFVAKLGSDGACSWSKASSAGGGIGEAIAVDAVGQILVAGRSKYELGPDWCDVTGDTLDQDAFVAKLAPDGACLWATRPSHSGSQVVLAAAADPLGNAFVTGRFSGAIAFSDRSPVLSTTISDVEAFVAKLLP